MPLAASGTTGELRATNNITAYYSSDIKFKTNIVPIQLALATIEELVKRIEALENKHGS